MLNRNSNPAPRQCVAASTSEQYSFGLLVAIHQAATRPIPIPAKWRSIWRNHVSYGLTTGRVLPAGSLVQIWDTIKYWTSYVGRHISYLDINPNHGPKRAGSGIQSWHLSDQWLVPWTDIQTFWATLLSGHEMIPVCFLQMLDDDGYEARAQAWSVFFFKNRARTLASSVCLFTYKGCVWHENQFHSLTHIFDWNTIKTNKESRPTFLV